MSRQQPVAQKRDKLDPFSLSFLDIISCGFGAVVVLILIFRPDPLQKDTAPPTPEIDTAAAYASLAAEAELSQQAEQAKASIESLAATKETYLETRQQLEGKLTEIKQFIADQQASRAQKQDQLDSLKTEIEQVNTAGAETESSNPDEEAGGILVDRDYVIFIVDTSGSMREIWGRVADQMKQILRQHPKVKGFQVMNDNGNYLISTFARRWITDTPKMRERVLGFFKNWGSTSNSSPAEGLERALQDYQSFTPQMSIYVLGDDFSGSDFDRVIERVHQLNEGGARINAINFISPNASTDRFSVLMREIALDNHGTLVTM